MNRILSVSKYQLGDFRKAAVIYYSIILALGLFLVIMTMASGNMLGLPSFSVSSVIFIFILGLNSFKTSFRFTQANNISRRTFYLANTLAIMAIAAIMSVVDFVVDSIFGSLASYSGVFELIYPQVAAATSAQLVWTCTLLALMASLGWLVTMVYYRCNTTMKVVVSVTPVIGIILFSFLNRITEGAAQDSLIRFLTGAMGFAGDTPNPYIAVGSFILAALVVIAVNSLLMYRVPIRD